MKTTQIVWWQWCVAGLIAVSLLGGLWKMSVSQSPQSPEIPAAIGAVEEADAPPAAQVVAVQ